MHPLKPFFLDLVGAKSHNTPFPCLIPDQNPCARVALRQTSHVAHPASYVYVFKGISLMCTENGTIANNPSIQYVTRSRNKDLTEMHGYLEGRSGRHV